MQTYTPKETAEETAWSMFHPLSAEDAAVAAAMRAIVEPHKGLMRGPAARQSFDEIMGHVSAPAGVTYEPDTVGDVPRWWCRPAMTIRDAAILYLHGGWYVWGSAQAYRHLAGQIAARAGAAAFVADYRLAPEYPFPAALLDARVCFQGLAARGLQRIAIAGDSAGGGLGLALLPLAAAQAASGGVVPVGAVALSPVTDLALTGQSWKTRAAADPYFTRSQAAGQVQMYFGDHDPKDPLTSPLFGDLAGLPPIRVHVGDDELLLDDSRRYVERAIAAGVDARVDIWQGLPHVFPSSVGRLKAADQALDAIGTFLSETLAPH